jgi:hypothetical protein
LCYSFSLRRIFSINLNGQELSILVAGADGTTNDFKQSRIVPEGIFPTYMVFLWKM